MAVLHGALAYAIKFSGFAAGVTDILTSFQLTPDLVASGAAEHQSH